MKTLPPKLMDRIISVEKKLVEKKGLEYLNKILRGEINKIELTILLGSVQEELIKQQNEVFDEQPFDASLRTDSAT